jgi:hypothetical protein
MPLWGSGAAAPQGALRAVDLCGAAAFLADLRPALPPAALHPVLAATDRDAEGCLLWC